MPKKKPLISKRQKQSTWIILFTILVLGSATFWIVKRNYSPPVVAGKTVSKEQRKVELSVYHLNDEAIADIKRLSPGEKIIFKMSSTFPASIALLEIRIARDAKVLIAGAHIPPGENRLIEVSDEKFVYSNLDSNPKRICLLAAADDNALRLLLQRVAQSNDKSILDVCLQIN